MNPASEPDRMRNNVNILYATHPERTEELLRVTNSLQNKQKTPKPDGISLEILEDVACVCPYLLLTMYI